MAIHGSMPNHITLSINKILESLFPKSNLRPSQQIPQNLNQKELEILFTIRYEEWESITVKRKNGEIDMLEITSKEEASEKIVEILNTGNYLDIEIKKRDGKIQCIKRKEMKKM